MEEKTEEILFVNSLKKDCILLNKNSLPEQNCLYTPHSLAIKIPSNNVHNKAQSRRANKALVIGEMPFELNEMDNLNNSINSSSNQNVMVKSNSNLKSKKWSIRESSDFSLNYIESPEAAAVVPVVYNKAALIPYLILPLNNRSNSNNDNEIEDEKEEEEASSSSKNKINNENENLDKKEEGDKDDQEQNDEKKKSELENKKEPVIEREHWDHKIEFLLAIIGFSVDLGNIWRCNCVFFIILI